MKHNLWYDPELELAFLQFKDDFLYTDVPVIQKKLYELLENKPYRQLLVIMSETGKVENRETREETNKALYNMGITDVAFSGGSAANRVIAKVLLKTGFLKIRGDFFKNQEEAVNWLIKIR